MAQLKTGSTVGGQPIATVNDIPDVQTYDDTALSNRVTTLENKVDKDTITTINGKTGAITKADITALGIPGQDTVFDDTAISQRITTLENKVDKDTITTINGKTGAISKADIVALGIPSQDTVYKKPSSEPISYIQGLQAELDSKVESYGTNSVMQIAVISAGGSTTGIPDNTLILELE